MRQLLCSMLAIAGTSAGCGQSVTGMPCDASSGCPEHYVCALAFDGMGRCMSECDPRGPTVCRDGRVCAPVAGTALGACYLGGNVAPGGACRSTLDCARGGLCFDRFASGAFTCLEGCNLDGSHPCLDGSACLSGGSAGFCNYQAP